MHQATAHYDKNILLNHYAGHGHWVLALIASGELIRLGRSKVDLIFVKANTLNYELYQCQYGPIKHTPSHKSLSRCPHWEGIAYLRMRCARIVRRSVSPSSPASESPVPRATREPVPLILLELLDPMKCSLGSFFPSRWWLIKFSLQQVSNSERADLGSITVRFQSVYFPGHRNTIVTQMQYPCTYNVDRLHSGVANNKYVMV